MATITYPLDLEGNSPANKITRELQVLIPQNDTPYRFFIPTHAPFYLNNLEIWGKDEVGTDYKLKEGIDYHPTMRFIGATRSTGLYVFAGITIINIKANGPFYVTYQCLGDKYSADRNEVVRILAEHNLNPREIAWDQITNIQETFPPTQHQQDLDRMTGFRDLIDSVDRITNVIPQQPGPNNVIWKHILDLNDPHQTLRLIPAITDFATKTDVAKAILDHTLEENPHKQYLLKDDYVPGGGGEVDPAKVKEIVDAAIAAHVAETDPHAQYLTDAEAQATYLTEFQADQLYLKKVGSASETEEGIVKFASIGEHLTGTENRKAATPAGVKAVMDKHEAASDPHPQYFNVVRGDERYLTKANAETRFVTKDSLQADFPTRTEIEQTYLKKSDADVKYLTTAVGDQRYMTEEKAKQTFPTKTEVSTTYLSKADADALYGPNGTNKPIVPDATTSVKGITRYATALEARALSSGVVALTPSVLRIPVEDIVDEKMANIGLGDGTFSSPALRLFFSQY